MQSSRDTVSRKLMVAMATDKLCKDAELPDITINEICAEAGISKPTFYRLFEDKFDIALWCSDLPMESGLKEVGRTLALSEGLRLTCGGLMMFRHLITASLDPNGVRVPWKIGTDQHAGWMRETLRDYKHVDIDGELEFQIDFFTRSSSEYVTFWLEGRFTRDVDEFSGLLDSCCPQRLRELLEIPVCPRPVGQRSDYLDLAGLFLNDANSTKG